jgi:hypothetical protein
MELNTELLIGQNVLTPTSSTVVLWCTLKANIGKENEACKDLFMTYTSLILMKLRQVLVDLSSQVSRVELRCLRYEVIEKTDFCDGKERTIFHLMEKYVYD